MDWRAITRSQRTMTTLLPFLQLCIFVSGMCPSIVIQYLLLLRICSSAKTRDKLKSFYIITLNKKPNRDNILLRRLRLPNNKTNLLHKHTVKLKRSWSVISNQQIIEEKKLQTQIITNNLHFITSLIITFSNSNIQMPQEKRTEKQPPCTDSCGNRTSHIPPRRWYPNLWLLMV